MIKVTSTFLLATAVFSILISPLFYHDIHAEKLSLVVNDDVFIEGQSLVITGQSSPNDEITIRLVAPDSGIKLFENIITNDSGSFSYTFVWPFTFDVRDYEYGVYVLDAINTSRGNTLSDKIDIKFVSDSTFQDYLDFAEKIVCGPGTELINRECTIISQVDSTSIESDTKSTSETKFTCGEGTEPVNGVCQIIKSEETKTCFLFWCW